MLYVENDRPEKSHDLIEWLWKKDYRLWWHLTPLFNPDNFFADLAERVSAQVVSYQHAVPAARDGDRPSTGCAPIVVNRHPLEGCRRHERRIQE